MAFWRFSYLYCISARRGLNRHKQGRVQMNTNNPRTVWNAVQYSSTINPLNGAPQSRHTKAYTYISVYNDILPSSRLVPSLDPLGTRIHGIGIGPGPPFFFLYRSTYDMAACHQSMDSGRFLRLG